MVYSANKAQNVPRMERDLVMRVTCIIPLLTYHKESPVCTACPQQDVCRIEHALTHAFAKLIERGSDKRDSHEVC